eukprot:TRINITY_DN75682_c0_g1_i1.p1 TRINITY_DN75682_c0_g1~~TRINITY_DN75682_c0_g1_i1.p1  ORF type:complete len:432 (+),score=58.28 TRINITY_DN75682_c0_g1_i1:37-1332(+)
MSLIGSGMRESLVEKDSKPTIWRVAWTVTIDLAMIGVGVALAMLGPTLADVAEQVQLDFVAAGSIFTFRASGYLLGASICGPMLDNSSNPAVVFMVPLVMATVGAFAVPTVHHYCLMCSLFVFQGVSMGMLDTGGNSLMLTIWQDSEYKNGHEHAMHFFFGLGAAVAPLVVAFTIDGGLLAMQAWTATAISLCPCCLGFLLLAFTPPPSNEDKDGADKSASIISWPSKTIVFTGVFLFIYVGTEVAYGGYLSEFVKEQLHASAAEGARVTSVYWAMLCAGRFVAALVTSHVNHTTYLAVHIFMAAAAMALLIITNLLQGGSWWGTVAGTSIFGFALAPLFPGAMLLAEETLGRSMKGTEASAVVVLAAFGESICPGAVGLAMHRGAIYFGCFFLATSVVSGCTFAAILNTGGTGTVTDNGKEDPGAFQAQS